MADASPPPAGSTEPEAHSDTHEDTGSDEISVAGLSGDLADAQDAKAHSASHENGGADEISVAGLSGDLADAQDPKSHDNTAHSEDYVTATDETILQALSTVKTDVFSESLAAESWSGDITGLSLSITPASTSSVILVIPTLAVQSTNRVAAGIYRDGSIVLSGDAAGNREPTTFGRMSDGGSSGNIFNMSGTLPDTPNTTNEVTYTVRLYNASGSGHDVYLNRSRANNNVAAETRPVSGLVLMEI